MNLFDKRPDVRWEATFVAPNATIVGDVELVDRTTTVWYGAVLRGDDNHISISKCRNQICQTHHFDLILHAL